MLGGMSASDPPIPDESYTMLPRSPELMSPHDTALLVVDVQQKLIGLLAGQQRLVWNVRRLLDGAAALGLRVVASEQYPQGLGKMLPELAQRLGPVPEKVLFSCRGCENLFEPLQTDGIFRILVCGIESHICVQQTVLDLIAAGFRVYVAVDAIGARGQMDHEIALRRMESSGATLTTTEAALFEWCQTSARPEFKQISALVKEQPPEA